MSHMLKKPCLPESFNRLVKLKEQIEMNQYNIHPNSVKHELKNSQISLLSYNDKYI